MVSMDYTVFKQKLLGLTGLDLSSYKEQQMHRRICQWIARHRVTDFHGLFQLVTENLEHRNKFLEYLTINTSHFFRDSAVFTAIANQVIPQLGTKRQPVKLWSAGCSIGAEVHSIAMLLQEQRVRTSEILATDLDEVILAKAKQGEYLPNQVGAVQPKLLKEYFSEKNNHYQIKEELRQLITFRKHNLLQDAFYTNMDLILCRNVFIYFTNETQKKLTQQFVAALKPQGFFIVGSAEQIMNPSSFGLTRVSYCIYQKE